MSYPQKLRLAVIGLGKLGLAHGAISNQLPNGELVAVADKESLITSTLQSWMPSLKVFGDHRQLLEIAKPDAVFITTPTDSHVSIALDCVTQQIPTFIEKPLAMSADEARP